MQTCEYESKETIMEKKLIPSNELKKTMENNIIEPACAYVNQLCVYVGMHMWVPNRVVNLTPKCI